MNNVHDLRKRFEQESPEVPHIDLQEIGTRVAQQRRRKAIVTLCAATAAALGAAVPTGIALERANTPSPPQTISPVAPPSGTAPNDKPSRTVESVRGHSTGPQGSDHPLGQVLRVDLYHGYGPLLWAAESSVETKSGTVHGPVIWMGHRSHGRLVADARLLQPGNPLPGQPVAPFVATGWDNVVGATVTPDSVPQSVVVTDDAGYAHKAHLAVNSVAPGVTVFWVDDIRPATMGASAVVKASDGSTIASCTSECFALTP
ncbi:MAG: hypothetical protein ACR2KG_02565 [Nocardioidaceae bacterium]